MEAITEKNADAWDGLMMMIIMASSSSSASSLLLNNNEDNENENEEDDSDDEEEKEEIKRQKLDEILIVACNLTNAMMQSSTLGQFSVALEIIRAFSDHCAFCDCCACRNFHA